MDGILKSRHAHELGGEIDLDDAVVDSGDGETMESVYAFCFPRLRRKILAGKGMAGNRPWIEASKTKRRGGRLFIIGVDGIKSHILNRLAHGRSIRFAQALPRVWFEQLASERLVVRYSRGQPQRQFERIAGRAAEALDCVVYGFAARQMLNVNWMLRRDELSPSAAHVPTQSRKVIKSNWMG